jgi:hypothetical protein
MSRLARKQFSAKLDMPDTKVMGTLPDKVSKELTKMILSQDTSSAGSIIQTVSNILQSPIRNVKADLYPAPIEGRAQISQNYDLENVPAVFYLITEGEMAISVGKQLINMQPNKIYFINDRNVYKMIKSTKTRTCLMSGIFAWNKDVHGE